MQNQSVTFPAFSYLPAAVTGEKPCCNRCRGPVGRMDSGQPFTLCYQCNQAALDFTPRVGILGYVRSGEQAYSSIIQYKNERPGTREAQAFLRQQLGMALDCHVRCLLRMVGTVPSGWTVVPSTRRPGTPASKHPLKRLMDKYFCNKEVPFIDTRFDPTLQLADTRNFSPSHYQIQPNHPPLDHILILEDMWVSGSHVLSLAKNLYDAGCRQVTILVLARKINDNDFWQGNCNQLRTTTEPCPWTLTGNCPTNPGLTV